MLAVLGAVLLVASLWPSADSLPLFCLIHLVTTVPCPSCGMTHAFVAMGHGNWQGAWQANLAGPALYVSAWIIFGLALRQALSNRDLLGAAWKRGRALLVPAVLTLMAFAWAANLVHRFSG